MTTLRLVALLGLVLSTVLPALRGDDGYRLWLRYERIADAAKRASYDAALTQVVLLTPTGAESPTLAAARSELRAGFTGLLGRDVPVTLEKSRDLIPPMGDGFVLVSTRLNSVGKLMLSAESDVGILYGSFDLLRRMQTRQSLDRLEVTSAPKVKRRLLNHWDNLTRTVERGYAGFSLWNWFALPAYLDPRYTDYARACASIGLNGTCLTNVNANATVLTEEYLAKVAALAGVFRPYGIRVYLTARFSAPKEIGGLPTADPLDPAVQAWWKRKADEIYRYVPDFGGFIVKANSEGQPGPQDYGRTHADGANTLADALAPHGGVVMWRAFVYSSETPDDRAKQAFNEFTPLDGKFRPNVFVQVKNGPIDFMPREPFHPLFGAMPRTPLTLELQITQEYLGCSTQLAFLAPMWKEVLESDTFAAGAGSTVARVISRSLPSGPARPFDGFDKLTAGTLRPRAEAEGERRDVPRLQERATADSAIAGVANTGTDRNWTGHPLAAANWYAFGRLAWDHTLTNAVIAEEWTRMTFSNDPAVVQSVVSMLLRSREAVVNYSMPLGLHHLMAEGHHYGPGPWVDKLGRADWTSVYYHHAAANGLGFDRTSTGSNAVGQYHPEVASGFGDPAQCPEPFLLWFHHVPWDRPLRSGRILWDELCLHYQAGVEDARSWVTIWDSLESRIDRERFQHVAALLRRQERDACFWRDACLLYFQTFSQRVLPAGVESPEHPLDYYRNFQLHYVPGHPAEMK